jgi:hypothetical protein
MKRTYPIFCKALLILALGSLQPVAAQAQSAFVPHEARYDLSLLEARGVDAASVDGLFLARLARTCKGWVLDTDMQIKFGEQGQPQISLVSRSHHEETLSDDGTGGTLSFKTAQQLNGTTVALTAGTAERGPDGGLVRFDTPANKTLKLPAGTNFPVSGAFYSIPRLFGGERLVSQTLFDGGEEGALLTVDVAAGTPEPAPDGVAGDRDLLDSPAIRTVTAFYDPDTPDSEPLSTYVADYHANGIATRLSLDIGLAMVGAEVSAIRRLPEPEC